MISISQHVTLEELTDSQTATRYNIDNTPDKLVIGNLKKVCYNLIELIREHYQLPVHISSGYRSIALNHQIGGANNSQHITGQAIDFTIQGISVADTVKYIMSSGLVYDQLISEGTWVHISYNEGHNRQQALLATFVNGKAQYKSIQ